MKLKRAIRKLTTWFSGVVSQPENLPDEVLSLLGEVRAQKLTYLSSGKLTKLAELCIKLRDAKISGLFIEAGCALGGSSIVLGKLKPAGTKLRIYDVFDMIPPPTEKDGADVHQRYELIRSGKSKGLGGDKYYGYMDNLQAVVRHNLESFGLQCDGTDIELIKGLVEDTLQVDQPVLLAHIDVDWFKPVTACLERLVPRLAPQGFIVLDDYEDWSGCRAAVDQYFRDKRKSYQFDLSGGNLVVSLKPTAG